MQTPIDVSSRGGAIRAMAASCQVYRILKCMQLLAPIAMQASGFREPLERLEVGAARGRGAGGGSSSSDDAHAVLFSTM